MSYYYIEENDNWKNVGEIVFDITDETGLQTIGKVLQLNEFLYLPEGIGGRVGVLPWYPARVRSPSGKIRKTYMVRMGVSNHMYVSDFGGGFGPDKSPYVGLFDELKDEVPQWKRLFIQSLSEEDCLILLMEQRETRYVAQRPPFLALQILILLPVSREKMNQHPFQATTEIRAIMDRTLDQFHDMVDHRPTIGNSAIRMYGMFRERVKPLFDRYFYSDQETNTVYNEALLQNNQVQVLLGNDRTTRPFHTIVRNNRAFSDNSEVAWQKRKQYGLRIMKGKDPNENEPSWRSPRRMTHKKNHKKR